MQHPAYLEVTPREPEIWTREDAEVWNEAKSAPSNDAWTEDGDLLESYLWLDGGAGDDLSVAGLRRLGLSRPQLF